MDTTAQEEFLKLRRRVEELKHLGYMTPEAAGTYEQTIFQTLHETERRRRSFLAQAETLRRQAAAADAQAAAFAMMSSILYNIVNGFVEAGQKRLREDAERDAECAAQNASSPAVIPLKRGRKKAQPEQKVEVSDLNGAGGTESPPAS